MTIKENFVLDFMKRPIFRNISRLLLSSSDLPVRYERDSKLETHDDICCVQKFFFYHKVGKIGEYHIFPYLKITR